MVYPILAVLGYGVLIGIVIFILSSSKYFLWGKLPQEVPPGSMGWPLIGETLSFLQPHTSNSLGKFLEEHCSRYGKVFRSHLFGSPTIVSCDPELNGFILQNEGKLFISNLPKHVRKILGEQSTVVVSGQSHKRLRSVTVSLINTFKISPEFLSYVEKSVIGMMDNWKEKELKEIHFLNEAKGLTFHLILKKVLDINYGDPKRVTIQKELFTTMKGLRSLPVYIPGNSYDKAVKARTRLDLILTRVISEKKKVVNDEKMKDDLNDEEKAMVVRLLLGGYESASELMAVTVYFLSRTPHAFRELKEEHESLRKGKKEGEPLSLEDYKKMVFTLKVINESLRCGNVGKYVPRKALHDVRYKGFLIPSGWGVLPIFSATHMDPSLHENPSEFNPWRWNDEDTKRNMMPFGGGPRLCPGAEFAKLVIAFFLHHFILRFSWKIRDDECVMLRPYQEFKREMILELTSYT